MDVDLVTSGILEEEDILLVDDYNHELDGLEGERCGICMDVIVDRGVLDCCQHWFCFACIDNWATITNLCPLCQSEFQLITCVPVYDTIGSKKADEDLISREDDWSIEGKSNTLSFPSYYIDENAVACLDGGGCKIQSHLASIKGVADLDTSIACDSCDKWYHAFCVGFDVEGTSEDTWLCPRCVSTVDPAVCGVVTLEKANNECNQVTTDKKCSMETAFSRKLTVSVADDGETAVVVSLVEGDQGSEQPIEKFLPKIELHEDLKIKASNSDGSPRNVEATTSDMSNIQQLLDRQGLKLSLSQKLSSCPSDSFTLTESKPNEHLDIVNAMSMGKSTKASCSQSHATCVESNIGLHLGLSEGSYSSVDNINDGGNKNQGLTGLLVQNPAEGFSSHVEKISHDGTEHTSRTIGVKREPADFRDDVIFEDEKQGSRKKIRAEEFIHMASKDQSHVSVTDDIPRCPTSKLSSDSKVRNSMKREDICDIMAIVRGTSCRTFKGVTKQIHANASPKDKENAAGLRVKKIMRRASEDKDSSIVMQNLRKEIREAVRNRSSTDIGENLFDPKLLAAFRAAVAGPKPDSVKPSPLAVKMKKNMMQKGKVRENLTKKIYGDSNGRRRRAWDRDCEVEFWKYRCMRASRPEKIETLKSVLDVLRKNPDGSENEPTSNSQASNPILSRLYLADTSVFPRKDDIKPLLDLNPPGSSEQNKEQSTSVGETSNPVVGFSGNNTVMYNGQAKTGIPSADTKGGKTGMPDSKGTAAFNRFQSNRGTEVSPVSLSAAANISSKKEVILKSDAKKEVVLKSDTKVDKRKLALEVLSRRKAAENKIGACEKDNAVLKGNYPLLAQLPVDMRPSLAPSRHNKIPFSVRQAQLYRLAEYFLRKTNLPFIRRTAETELAVADAINIEKEVADRSNSKVVYLNLCSQEILHRSDHAGFVRSRESDTLPPSVTDRQEQGSDDRSTDPEVLDALRNAGLLSDSPPTSPSHRAETFGGKNDPSHRAETSGGKDDPSHKAEISGETDALSTKNREEESDNVFEMDSHLEADIYGDFEYDLEDDDYIHVSAEKAPKLQIEENLSKMKVFLSTLASERSNNAVVLEGGWKSGNGASTDPCSVPESPTKVLVKDSSSIVEGRSDRIPCECVPDAEGEELSLAECEELYGPDKEPLVNKFPEAMQKPHGKIDAAVAPELKFKEDSNKHASHTTADASGSRNEIGAVNIEKENKPNAEADKQPENVNYVSKKVEAYIKEHIRPLCKSGVITAEQYRWAVLKTTDKVMKYHSNAKNANFLIKEGEKVKKLAEQYIEAAQQKEKTDPS